MESQKEKIHSASDSFRYGRNLYSRIRNLSSKTDVRDIQRSIDILIDQTKAIDAEKHPGKFKQIIDTWKSVGSDYRIEPYLKEKYPFILKEPGTWLAQDTRNSPNIPSGIASEPGMKKQTSTVHKNEIKNDWFVKTVDTLGTLASITELGNMSDADWDGSCAQLGTKVAHGLFGKKDVEGVDLWSLFTDLIRKEEERENEKDPISAGKRVVAKSKVIYKQDNGKISQISAGSSTVGRFVPEASKEDLV